MKKFRLVAVAAGALILSCLALDAKGIPSEAKFTRELLLDKIRGAWAGQVLGCTYGGPTEFKYNGMVHADVPLEWNNPHADDMKPVSDIPFVHTDISFNKACEYSLLQALPVSGNGSAAELFWKYNLPEGKHTVDFRFLNKEDDMNIVIDNYIVYSSIPREIQHETK